MLFLGFSAGLPLLLIFSSLSLWLREAGIERSAVTYFSWAALGYSFKFVWAPLVGRLPLPLLKNLLGQRRAWLLLAQISIAIAIAGMALIDPAAEGHALVFMGLAAVLLGFSAATQDIVIDAYRIEAADKNMQALMSSVYIAGYRIGMLVAGAGALFIADFFGSDMGAYSYAAWSKTYLLMAACMLVGLITTLLISEPELEKHDDEAFSGGHYAQLFGFFCVAVCAFIAVFYFSADLSDYLKFVLAELFSNNTLASLLVESLRLLAAVVVALSLSRVAINRHWVNPQLLESSYMAPIREFFQRYAGREVMLLLALIFLYRLSDIVLGVVANVFYQDLGFTKTEIAAVVKTFGLLMTIVGGFLGGLLSLHFGIMRILFLGAVLAALTNVLFMLLAKMGASMPMLYLVISADNLAAGLAGAAFVAFLSSLVNMSFTAMQYAIFSSMMTLFPKLLGGYSGAMVDSLGYPQFFMLTALMGLPVLWVIMQLRHFAEFKTD
ncbi:MAG: MFS transporter [Pseudomonadales bacterium]|nr:MFS transporter [Pseudomonadales bacterium]